MSSKRKSKEVVKERPRKKDLVPLQCLFRFTGSSGSGSCDALRRLTFSAHRVVGAGLGNQIVGTPVAVGTFLDALDMLLVCCGLFWSVAGQP